MESLVEKARRIFEVARSAAAEEVQDFAVLIKPDGGLHFIMESAFSLDAVACDAGAQSAFRITTSGDGVRVLGQAAGNAGVRESCLIEQRNLRRTLLRDQPLYRITSPLLISGSAGS